MHQQDPCPSDEAARVAVMARRQKSAETRAPSGTSSPNWSSADWMTSSRNGEACDEILYLTGAAMKMQEAHGQLGQPVSNLDSLVYAVRHGRQILNQEQVRISCLRTADHALPHGARYVQEEFDEAKSLFLDASRRLADMLDRLVIFNESAFVDIFRALLEGAPVPSPAVTSDADINDGFGRQVDLGPDEEATPDLELDVPFRVAETTPTPAPVSREDAARMSTHLKEQTTAAELRRTLTDPSVPSESRQLERWCMFWTVALAGQRLWTEQRQTVGGCSEAELESIVRHTEMAKDWALRVALLCSDRIPQRRLQQLDRTITALFDTTTALCGDGESFDRALANLRARVARARQAFVSGLRQATATEEIEPPRHPFGVRKRRNLQNLARKQAGSRSDRTQRGPSSRGGVLVAVVMLLAGVLSWEPLFEPMLNVSTLDPANLGAHASVITSGYLVNGDQGETLVGKVSDRWVHIQPAARQKVVRSLLNEYRDRGVTEVVLRDDDGQVVAHAIPGRLALAQ